MVGPPGAYHLHPAMRIHGSAPPATCTALSPANAVFGPYVAPVSDWTGLETFVKLVYWDQEEKQ